MFVTLHLGGFDDGAQRQAVDFIRHLHQQDWQDCQE